MITAATPHQPAAAAALTAALARGPSHAYLLAGPAGSGKAAAARAFAAELLADAAEPEAAEEARRRAMLDPSPHPDLIWLEPTGLQYRVEEIRERLLRPAHNMPYEGGRRILVVEAAEAMREESQNALLKTLEEPPSHTHLILLATGPEDVLPTIRSRCQFVSFQPLPDHAVLESIGESEDPLAVTAARLARGDVARARLLLGATGKEIRRGAHELALSTLPVEPRSDEQSGTGAAARPWGTLLDAAESAGEEAEANAENRLEAEEEYGFKLGRTERTQLIRREGRRARTECLDLGLELLAAWYRDLAMLNEGVEEVVHNRDSLDLLRRCAEGLEARRLHRAVQVVADTRRRLRLNVSEELALEALQARLSLFVAA